MFYLCKANSDCGGDIHAISFKNFTLTNLKPKIINTSNKYPEKYLEVNIEKELHYEVKTSRMM